MNVFKAINSIPASELIADNGLDSPKLPKKLGNSGAKIKCIFHADKTPSWVIYPEDRATYCFGCGKAHTSYDILKHLDYSISDMIELCKEYGIDIDEDDVTQSEEEPDDTLKVLVATYKNKPMTRKNARALEKAIKSYTKN